MLTAVRFFRLIAQAALSLPLLLLGVMTLAQARPVHQMAMVELTPLADCAQPCWLGIRPGETGAEDALQRLQNHPWVRGARMTYVGVTRQTGRIEWQWNGGQPPWLPADDSKALAVFRQGIVSEMNIPTTIALGDLWLTFGPPDTYVFAIEQRRYPSRIILRHSTLYNEAHVWFIGQTRCPYFPELLHSRVSLRIESRGSNGFLLENYPFSRRAFLGEVLTYRRIVCRRW